ncbi:MAG: DUF2184 domain-containing protein [Methyloglobulus sp.]|nr:DUF2184 domain-containing protein [Methyloglobulus sp.]
MAIVSKTGVKVSAKRLKNHYEALKSLDYTDAAIMQSLGFPVMDAAQAATTLGYSGGVPLQFLQTFMPGVVRVLQAPLKLEEAIGFTQAGSWEDVEIVQELSEGLGFAREYGDLQEKPNVTYNREFLRQDVVRFEVGVESHALEAARASRGQINDLQEKTNTAALILKQILNDVGFNGYQTANTSTYGLLNNPNLPAYVTAANGVSASPLWSTKTWDEKQKDIIAMANGLMTQSKGLVDAMSTPTTLIVPVSLWNFFQTTTSLGYSLMKWIEDSYRGNMRVMSAFNMDGANGGLNAMYLFADNVNDGISTDSGETFMQVIPTRFMPLNTAITVTGQKTAYTAGTAGTFVKRPFAVYRLTGV